MRAAEVTLRDACPKAAETISSLCGDAFATIDAILDPSAVNLARLPEGPWLSPGCTPAELKKVVRLARTVLPPLPRLEGELSEVLVALTTDGAIAGHVLLNNRHRYVDRRIIDVAQRFGGKRFVVVNNDEVDWAVIDPDGCFGSAREPYEKLKSIGAALEDWICIDNDSYVSMRESYSADHLSVFLRRPDATRGKAHPEERPIFDTPTQPPIRALIAIEIVPQSGPAALYADMTVNPAGVEIDIEILRRTVASVLADLDADMPPAAKVASWHPIINALQSTFFELEKMRDVSNALVTGVERINDLFLEDLQAGRQPRDEAIEGLRKVSARLVRMARKAKKDDLAARPHPIEYRLLETINLEGDEAFDNMGALRSAIKEAHAGGMDTRLSEVGWNTTGYPTLAAVLRGPRVAAVAGGAS